MPTNRRVDAQTSWLLLTAVTVATIGTSCSYRERKPVGPAPGFFRIRVLSRDTINGNEGGILQISVNPQAQREIPVAVRVGADTLSSVVEVGDRDLLAPGAVRTGTNTLSGTIKPNQPNMNNVCLFTITPKNQHGKNSVMLQLLIKSTTWNRPGWNRPGWSSGEKTMSLSQAMSMTLEKEGKWVVKPGDYRENTPLTIASLSGKPLTLLVGSSTR